MAPGPDAPPSGTGRPRGTEPLSVLGQAPAERADAARNRRKILGVAARLAADGGVESLAMDEVARHAGVGVGTIYRRFGDRSGLVMALIDSDEQDFQRQFLHGPPPLGPGADPRTRILAFLRAMVARIESRGEFMLEAEAAGPRHRFGHAYALQHTHLAALLAEAAPGADAAYLADALLAPVSAAVVTHQLTRRGMSVRRIQAGLEVLLDALLPTSANAERD